MTRDILAVIQNNLPTFSKGQKLIAKFILSSYDKAAFMTASRLGKTVNVSESTVVRFAAELGYDGYPSMQKALQEMIRNKLTSIQRIEVSNDRIGNQDVLSMVMQSDIEKIRMTLEETDRKSFDASVEAIVRARRIYILGVRSASALSGFLSFYFNLI
jgi:DNA-binding MurR/RpiR family transcriptional regulator